ncbi:MAG: hypothetical protein EOM67_05965 [Spirochaetia bacterium]|nr:hypothetical protein [Spirochaetia bacterium]
MNDEKDFQHVLIFVDADSCPKALRSIILKAVVRRKIPSVFVADRVLPDVVKVENGFKDNKDPFLVKMIVVEKGDDSADDELVIISRPGALAVTRDVILADRLAEKGLTVLDDRGGVFTSQNVKERLSIRNMMSELREYDIYSEKTKPMGPKEIQLFANALDREITKITKQ